MTGQVPPCGHLRTNEADEDALGPQGAAASMYARTFGIPVLRLVPGRSDPAIRHGVHGATADSRQIQRMFRAEGNLGGVTGGGWLVADLDRKNGDDGPAELVAFMARHGVTLPPAPYARTPSNGRHLWMRTDAKVPSRYSSSRIIPGVDLLADGGHYVVLPPSVRLVKTLRAPGDPPGGERLPVPYTWADGCCLCQAPAAPGWLTDAMRLMPSIGPVSGGGGGGGRGWAGAPPLPPTDELLAAGLSPGRRSYDMYRLALRLYRQHGQDAAAVVEAVCYRAWLATAQGGESFDWDEAARCIRSGREFAAAQEAKDRLVLAQFTAHMARWRA